MSGSLNAEDIFASQENVQHTAHKMAGDNLLSTPRRVLRDVNHGNTPHMQYAPVKELTRVQENAGDVRRCNAATRVQPVDDAPIEYMHVTQEEDEEDGHTDVLPVRERISRFLLQLLRAPGQLCGGLPAEVDEESSRALLTQATDSTDNALFAREPSPTRMQDDDLADLDLEGDD